MADPRRGDASPDDTADPRRVTPLEAQRLDPEHATSELAPETPPQEDAERLEAGLREGGPLAGDRYEQRRREQPTDRGGTSLT